MLEMKDSGMQSVGLIPATWNRTLLEHCATIIRGGSPRPIDQYMSSDNSGYSWIKIGDTVKGNKYICEVKEKIIPAGLSKTRLVKSGDLLLTNSMSYGEPYILKVDGCIHDGWLAFSNIKKLHKEYLYYLLLSAACRVQFEQSSDGGVVQNLNIDKVKHTVVFYPAEEEQRRIALFLDAKCAEIDALAADIQSQIDTLEQYKRSVITEAVTKGLNPDAEMRDSGTAWIGKAPSHWAVKRTKFLFEIVKRIAGKEGFDVLSVTQKGLKVKDLSDYSGQIAENYSGYQFVYPTDYVMNHMDLLTGWVDCSEAFGVTSPDYRVFRLLNQNEHDLTYFKYVFQCLYMNRIYYSFGNGVSGMGRWRLQTSTFLNFLLPVPPRAEQHRIAEFIGSKVSEIDGIIDVKKQQLETLDEYKKSLIFEYVTGKKAV